MKIAYVAYLIAPSSGVERRMQAMAASMPPESHHQVDFFLINPHATGTHNQVHYLPFQTKPYPFSYVDYLFQKFSLIERAVDLDQYDHIILRYPLADPSGAAFMQRYAVITEHHTNEVAEKFAQFQAEHRVVAKVMRRLRYQLEQHYGRQLLKFGKGLVAVTDEIRALEEQRIAGGTSRPATTIGNGISVASVQQTGFRPFSGSHLHLAFVASHPTPWHGLDRIIRSLAEYKEVKTTLHIIGAITPSMIKPLSSSHVALQFHGTQHGSALDAILSNMHAGISTMALYRKGMSQACSLKTREYTARGLPFLLAYQDADLAHVEKDLTFFLNFPNDDTLIDMERVCSFLTDINRKNMQRTLSDYMRTYALQQMDWKSKMQQYLQFVEQCASC